MISSPFVFATGLQPPQILPACKEQLGSARGLSQNISEVQNKAEDEIRPFPECQAFLSSVHLYSWLWFSFTAKLYSGSCKQLRIVMCPCVLKSTTSNRCVGMGWTILLGHHAICPFPFLPYFRIQVI